MKIPAIIRQRISFYQADIHGKQLVKQRMETLQMMMEAKSQVTVITTIDGFMDELPSEAEIKGTF